MRDVGSWAFQGCWLLGSWGLGDVGSSGFGGRRVQDLGVLGLDVGGGGAGAAGCLGLFALSNHYRNDAK